MKIGHKKQAVNHKYYKINVRFKESTYCLTNFLNTF